MLAQQLNISDDEIAKIRGEYTYVSEQALVMLHLWVQKNEGNATGTCSGRHWSYVSLNTSFSCACPSLPGSYSGVRYHHRRCGTVMTDTRMVPTKKKIDAPLFSDNWPKIHSIWRLPQ